MRRTLVGLAAGIAVAALIAGLWLIDHAAVRSWDYERPEHAKWAAWLLGAGAIAAGQAALFGGVVYPIYGGHARRLTAAVAMLFSIVAALAAAVVGFRGAN